MTIDRHHPGPARGEDKFGYAGVCDRSPEHGTALVTTLDRWNKGDEASGKPQTREDMDSLVQNAEWDQRLRAPTRLGLKTHWSDALFRSVQPDHEIFVTGYGVWACEDLTAADSAGQRDGISRMLGWRRSWPPLVISPQPAALDQRAV